MNNIQKYMTKIEEHVTKLTNLGELKRYIGVDIIRDHISKKITLKQHNYIKTYLEDKNLSQSQTKRTPLNHTLSYKNNITENNTNKPINDSVGQIRYLADWTRPDLLVAAGILGSAASNPGNEHLKGLNHVNKYLLNTIDESITLGGDSDVELFGFSDAAFIRDGDSKPQYGYCFYLNRNSGAVYARSMKGNTVSMSSTEAEMKALVETVKECIWMREFLKEISFEQQKATTIYVDNTATIALTESMKNTKNIKHFLLILNFLRQEINNKTIILKYIDTNNNVADILTKPLNIIQF
jgi:hypothetical protein